MCVTCDLIRADVQVCGVLVRRAACGQLHCVSGASEEVLGMLTQFLQSREPIPLPSKRNPEPVGSCAGVKDHDWTLEYLAKNAWKLCFHVKYS